MKLFINLSQTVWVFGFKLFHIVPLPYHWFKNKWKTLRLIICNKLLVEAILAQRNYIITTMKILCTKITTIVRLVDEYYISSTIGDINWVSKFKTRSKNDIIDWNIR